MMGNAKLYFAGFISIILALSTFTNQSLYSMQEEIQEQEKKYRNSHLIIFLTKETWNDFEWFNQNNGVLYKKIKKVCTDNKKLQKLIQKVTKEKAKEDMGSFDVKSLVLKKSDQGHQSLEKLEHAQQLVTTLQEYQKKYQYLHIVTSGASDGPCIIGLASQLMDENSEEINRIEPINREKTSESEMFINHYKIAHFSLFNNNPPKNLSISHVVIIGKHDSAYAFNDAIVKHVDHITPAPEKEDDINFTLLASEENKHTIHKPEEESSGKCGLCLKQSKPYVEIAVSLFLRALPLILAALAK